MRLDTEPGLTSLLPKCVHRPSPREEQVLGVVGAAGERGWRWQGGERSSQGGREGQPLPEPPRAAASPRPHCVRGLVLDSLSN